MSKALLYFLLIISIYFQVTGTYDSSKYGLNPNDQGTQFDDSLASQGGVLPQSGCRGAQGYLEYFGANIFCIRCCRHAFSFYCDPSHDTRGCAKGIPGDYGPGFSNNGVGVNGSPGSTFGSAPTPPRPGIVSDWAQCSPHTDKCASSGWTCCQAPADAAAGNGKTTCRAPGYCAATPGPNPYAGGVGASSSAPAGVKDWNTCGDGDVCASSSFVCCVAKGDFTAGSSKKTCRPSSDCSSGSSGSINTGGKLIPNWNDCKAGVDSCNSGYTCCQAPADAAAGNGKTTCRASNAPGQSYGCSTSSSSSSGKLVSNWGNCRVGVDSCNSGYKCCIGPADKSTSKYTCRVSNAPGQSYGCSA